MKDVLYKQRLITPFTSPATEAVCLWTFTGLNPGSVWGQFLKAVTSYTQQTHNPLYHIKCTYGLLKKVLAAEQHFGPNHAIVREFTFKAHRKANGNP